MNQWEDKLLAALESDKSDATADPEVRAALRAHGRIEEMFALLQQPASLNTSSSEAYLQPGIVLGEFSIIRELGAGGMGQVYLAKQASLDRLVALKVCPPSVASDPRLRARFETEGKSLAKLRHRHVVPVLMTGEHEGLLYLAMEYVAGPTLDQVLTALCAASSELSATEVVAATIAGLALSKATDQRAHDHATLDRSYRTWIVETLQKVAQGLAAIHQAGMLHRDIKPANIVLDANGEPKIVDFGLARGTSPSTLTVTGQFFGTPAYTSPEQASGSTVAISPAADVFSFGAVLYECLTLRRAFDATTSALVLGAVIHTDPPVLRRVDMQIPWELEAITDKCLRKGPAARYPSAVELASDLQNYLDVRPLIAKRLSWIGNVRRRVRRQPWAAAFVAAICVTLFLGVFLAARARQDYLAAQRVRIDSAIARGDSAFFQSGLLQSQVTELLLPAEVFDRWRKSAIDAYSAALEIDPEAVWALVQRGLLYSADDAKLELALNDLRRASALQRRYASIQKLLSRVYERTGNNEKSQLAETAAEQLYASAPEDVYWLGVVAIQQGEDPTRFLSDCLKLAPNHYWAQILFASHSSSLSLQQHVEELRVAKTLRSDLPFADELLVFVRFEQDKDPQIAADAMRSVIDRFGVNVFRSHALSKFLTDLGQFKEAEAALLQVLDEESDGFTESAIGRIKLQQEDYEDAAVWFQRAIDQGLTSSVAYDLLAFSLSNAGDFSTAETIFKDTLDAHPNDLTLHVGLGLLYNDNGRPGDAEKSFRRALELPISLDGVRQNTTTALSALQDLYASLESLLVEQGRQGERIALLSQALQQFDRLRPAAQLDESDAEQISEFIAHACLLLGTAHFAQGNREAIEKLVAERQSIPSVRPPEIMAITTLQAMLGNHEEVLSTARSQEFASRFENDDKHTASSAARSNVDNALLLLGKYEELVDRIKVREKLGQKLTAHDYYILGQYQAGLLQRRYKVTDLAIETVRAGIMKYSDETVVPGTEHYRNVLSLHLLLIKLRSDSGDASAAWDSYRRAREMYLGLLRFNRRSYTNRLYFAKYEQDSLRHQLDVEPCKWFYPYLLKSGRLSECQSLEAKIRELLPRSSAVNDQLSYVRGLAAVEAGMHESAVKSFRQCANSEHVPNGVVYAELAKCYRLLERRQDAMHWCRLALQSNEKSADVLFSLVTMVLEGWGPPGFLRDGVFWSNLKTTDDERFNATLTSVQSLLALQTGDRDTALAWATKAALYSTTASKNLAPSIDEIVTWATILQTVYSRLGYRHATQTFTSFIATLPPEKVKAKQRLLANGESSDVPRTADTLGSTDTLNEPDLTHQE